MFCKYCRKRIQTHSELWRLTFCKEKFKTSLEYELNIFILSIFFSLWLWSMVLVCLFFQQPMSKGLTKLTFDVSELTEVPSDEKNPKWQNSFITQYKTLTRRNLIQSAKTMISKALIVSVCIYQQFLYAFYNKKVLLHECKRHITCAHILSGPVRWGYSLESTWDQRLGYPRNGQEPETEAPPTC